MHITFYDVSATQELSGYNGHTLTLEQLYVLHTQYRTYGQVPSLTKEEFCSLQFHPYGADGCGWSVWWSYFSTMTILLSGHATAKHEMKAVRDYLERLPKAFKRSVVDQQFVLGFIAYLFIGFRSHTGSGYYNEANATQALVDFTTALYERQHALMTSVLCAHRDPKTGEELNLLQSFIPQWKVHRAAALALALIHNVRKDTRGTLLFFQQPVSQAASSSVFPEVTVEYLERGLCVEMLERLRYQYRLVSNALASMSAPRSRCRLASLDTLTRRIHAFLAARYGENWRDIEYTELRYPDDPLVEIALNMTLPDVERMMPFFADAFQQGVFARKDELVAKNCAYAREHSEPATVDTVASVIEWFVRHNRMTLTAKAMYETAFYYLWGWYSGRCGGFGIGFDRDHDRFQHFAWHRGALDARLASDATQQCVPLYARRHPDGYEAGTLVDLSFRQFWR